MSSVTGFMVPPGHHPKGYPHQIGVQQGLLCHALRMAMGGKRERVNTGG